MRPIRTRFRYGSLSLNLADKNKSPSHYAIGTRSDFRLAPHSPPTVCRHTVSGTISLPSKGFFSPFPHGTGSLSVRRTYVALRDGPRSFSQGFSCPAILRYQLRVRMIFAYVAITLYGPSFQRDSTNHRIGNSTVAGPTTPVSPEGEAGLG